MSLQTSSINNPPFLFVDLFSGCGGFSHGLERSGLQCLLAVDSDSNAISTFKKNHSNASTYCGDIRDLTNASVLNILAGRRVDLIVGGPPCQGFSTVGRGEISDSRNYLFLEYLRFVELLRPNGVVIENVTGLLAKKNRAVLVQILSRLQDLGYKMKSEVLLAEEYGVPQKRRRAILVGFKDGYRFKYPTPSESFENGFKTVGDAFKDINANTSHHSLEFTRIHNQFDIDRLMHIPPGAGIRYKKDQDLYLPSNLHYDHDWSTIGEGRFRQTRLQRLDFNSQSPTILTSKTTYYHPTECRYLTVREVAALQTFPNEFEFVGSVTSMFRQIGNAVPVKLAQALGEELINSLNNIA